MTAELYAPNSTVPRNQPREPTAPSAHDELAQSAGTIKLGFWIYLMSDCLLFAALFATFAVLKGELAGGPGPDELFDLRYVLVETGCLLFSSFTYGLAMVAAHRQRRGATLGCLAATFLLGLVFISMEVSEFRRLISEGAGPDRSAFLSSFFALVGTHGLHVTAGLVWMAVMIAQVLRKGLTSANAVGLMCLSLFWHFLDIIWIGVFTFVYLLGVS